MRVNKSINFLEVVTTVYSWFEKSIYTLQLFFVSTSTDCLYGPSALYLVSMLFYFINDSIAIIIFTICPVLFQCFYIKWKCQIHM